MGRRELCGIPLVAGIVSGSAWWLQADEEAQSHVTATGQTGWQLLQEARQAAVEELRALIESRRAELAPDDLAVLEAQVLMIQDPQLDRLVAEALDRGLTVEEAWEGRLSTRGSCSRRCLIPISERVQPMCAISVPAFFDICAEGPDSRQAAPKGFSLLKISHHQRLSPWNDRGFLESRLLLGAQRRMPPSCSVTAVFLPSSGLARSPRGQRWNGRNSGRGTGMCDS